MKTAKIVVLLGLFFLSACGLRTYYPETNPPPRSREGIHEAVPQDIYKVQAKKTASQELCDSNSCITVTLVSPDNNERKPVSNCDDYGLYQEQGWSTDPDNYTNDDFNNDYAFIESCNILKFVENAQSSRYSRFIMPLMEEYAIQKLDPEMFYFLPFALKKTERENIWNAFHCGKQGCSADWGTVELGNGGLIVWNGNRHTSYFPAGRGDMNDDGWEDLLFNYYSYDFSKNGPDRISGHFCLSWPGKDQIPTVFDCIGDNFLQHLTEVQ